MACARFCSSERLFVLTNLAFAMYAGALLATAARLAWDPSTYTWFRYFCDTQYHVSVAYTFTAGLWLAALATLGASGARARRVLALYRVGILLLVALELIYAMWMAVSLAHWWREDPHAELVRTGVDLLNLVIPKLVAVEQFIGLETPLNDMVNEVQSKTPNNVFVIVTFGVVGAVLQIAAFILARGLEAPPPSLAKLPTNPTTKPLKHGGIIGWVASSTSSIFNSINPERTARGVLEHAADVPYPDSRANCELSRELPANHDCGSDPHILRRFAPRSPKIVGILVRDKGIESHELGANVSPIHIPARTARVNRAGVWIAPDWGAREEAWAAVTTQLTSSDC